MKIATYNVNSIRMRGANLCQWLKQYNPDIVFLQEIKCETKDFLFFEFESLGYHVAAFGQKSYNGVAILSKYPFQLTSQNLPNFPEDDASRYLEILVNTGSTKFYATSIYAPNGCSSDKQIEKEKLAYKLKWFDKLYEHLTARIYEGYDIVLGGDFNVMMSSLDLYSEKTFINSPLYIKEVKDKLYALQYAGFYDAFRLLHPNKEGYTFWDYSANAFITNSGLRIDYIFVTASLAQRLISCEVNKTLRQQDKPSDHTILIAEFED